jgi:predicted ATPase
MIKKIYIDNFKGLNDFELSFHPLTVLIGNNSAGKTSVLQVIELFANFINQDINDYFKNKIWSASGFKSKLNRKKYITFSFEIDLKTHFKDTILWKIVLLPDNQRKYFTVIEEEIMVLNDHTKLNILQRNKDGLKIKSTLPNVKPIVSEIPINTNSTAINNLIENTEKYEKSFPIFFELKKIVSNIMGVGLINPEKIRENTSEISIEKIISEGENLSSFLFHLSKDNKNELRTYIKGFINSFQNLKLRKRKNNTITFDITEIFDNKEYTFNSKYLSDGFLRIITLLSLSELKSKNGIILIDEIENGVNPHLVGSLVNQLLNISEKFEQQIIITTHNHIFVNYVPEQFIVYIWKDDKGKVKAKHLFENQELQKQLKYLNTGDIWVNLDSDEILNYLKD